jgi:hypothetical protein
LQRCFPFLIVASLDLCIFHATVNFDLLLGADAMDDPAASPGAATRDDMMYQLQAEIARLQVENQQLHAAQVAQQQQDADASERMAQMLATQESITAQAITRAASNNKISQPRHTDIPQYRTGEDINAWTMSLDVIFQAYPHLPPSQKISFASYGLSVCNGLPWWATLGVKDHQRLVDNGMGEWDAFKKIIVARFNDPALNGKIYKQTINLTQRNGETVAALFTRFFTQTAKLGHTFDDFMIKNTIRFALADAILQRMTINWDTATVDEVRHNASEAERDLLRNGIRIFTPKPKYTPRGHFNHFPTSSSANDNGTHDGASGSGATPMELGVRAAAPGSNGPHPPGHCFNCGVKGHWESQCTVPLRPERRAARQRWAQQRAAKAAADRARKGKGPAVN